MGFIIQEGEKDPDEQSWGYFCDVKINVFLFWIVSQYFSEDAATNTIFIAQVHLLNKILLFNSLY